MLNFTPSLVVDVGAYHGEFAEAARKTWKDVPIIMIEALPEQKDILKKVCKQIDATALIAVVGPEDKPVEFTVMDNGSSVYPECTKYPRVTKTMQMYKLDSLLGNLPEKNVFLKLDVQGYELEVLRGAKNLLDHTEVIAVEASTMEYNKGGPLLHELLNEFANLGFVLFDIYGSFRREYDNALFQLDLLMIRKESVLRKAPYFWVGELDYA